MNSEFDATYRNFYPRLFRIATKMLQDSEGAKDVVQDVFTAYYFAMNDKKVINNTKNWLIRSTINKGVDYKRKNSKNVRTDDVLQNINNISTENQSDTTSILNLVETLNAKEKSVVVLYSEGYSYKEMAEITGIKFNSIGKTLERIIDKLKKQAK